MIVWGMPREVKTFFSKTVASCSRPIQQALAPMVLAFLLAPHRRCLKTIAGEVLSHRCHVATISRRLLNHQWRTRDWYVGLYDQLLNEVNAWERRQAKGRRRQWIVAIDTTYHSTTSEQMENLIVMSRRQDPARKTTRQHAFLMGLLLTDGATIGAVWVQARATDRLRMLETLIQRWNLQWIEHRLCTVGGQRRLLREQAPCQVA